MSADFTFTSENLINGILFVLGATKYSFRIYDDAGSFVDAAQYNAIKEGSCGVSVDLSSFDMGGKEWSVKFIEKSIISTIHNFIEPVSTGVPLYDTVINSHIYRDMWMFCEIMIHYENANKADDGNFHFTYHHWNRAYTPQVFLNGSDRQLDKSLYEVNYEHGYIIPKWTVADGDNMTCTYNFSWFTPETLESFIERAISTMNYRGSGQVTNYTSSDLPAGWYGICADLVQAMMCEHLILSQTMWYGKLIFSISANDLYNGGGGSDIASNLESMKRNAEDRAYAALDNENMRAPASIAKPTRAYWRAISIGNGVRPGPHGQESYGKTRGMKWNKGVGFTAGPDLDV